MQKPLTTAAKLTILEKAIEMGATINVDFHIQYSPKPITVNQACDVFKDLTPSEHSYEGTNWYAYGDQSEQFATAVFLPDYYPLPIGWAGDVEEDSGQ